MKQSCNSLNHSEPDKLQICLKGVMNIMPLSIAVIPWGILCGSLAISTGLTALQAQLMSLLVFAGAAQLAGISLMGAGAAASSIYSSTFVISSRHLLYSAVFREYVYKCTFAVRGVVAFFLTDEMFAVTVAYIDKHKRFSLAYALSSGICFYLIWNLATFIGIVAGQQIEDLEKLGLEFAIAATFIAIVVPSIKDKSTLVSVLVSGLCVLVLSVFEIEQGLIVATIVGMGSGYLTWRWEKKV